MSTAVGITLEGVSQHFDGIPVLRGVDLEVRAGEFAVLLGPSGCGKTTLLRLVAGLDDPSSGRIEIGGREVSGVPAERRDLGVVFQSYSLFTHLTVAKNVAFGLRMRRVPAAEREARVAEALDLVGLRSLADRSPDTLSGGQQQRVALARALVTRPRALLLDEPLSALDAAERERLRAEIRALQRRLGITTIFVTHDQHEALSLADRIAVIREGAIEQFATPKELYREPATAFVASFVGETNRLSGVAERANRATGDRAAGDRAASDQIGEAADTDRRMGENRADGEAGANEDGGVEGVVGVRGVVGSTVSGAENASVPLATHVSIDGVRLPILPGYRVLPGEAVIALVRPEHLSLGRSEGVPVRVIESEFQGGSNRTAVRLANGERAAVRHSNDERFVVGEPLRLRFSGAAVAVVAASGSAG